MEKNIFNKIVIIFVGLMIIGAVGNTLGDTENSASNSSGKTKLDDKPEVTVVDFSGMAINDIIVWCETNKVECYTKEEYSDTVAKSSFVSQDIKSGDKIYEGENITIIYSLDKEPSRKYINALAKAKSYQNTINMSKNAIYDQLISQYEKKFTKSEAQYAIEHLDQ